MINVTTKMVEDWTGKILAECATTSRSRKRWRELVRGSVVFEGRLDGARCRGRKWTRHRWVLGAREVDVPVAVPIL